MSYRITVILDPQLEGGYTVTCQELPELITQGDSIDEALKNVEDAFATTLELYEHLGRPLPAQVFKSPISTALPHQNPSSLKHAHRLNQKTTPLRIPLSGFRR